MVKKKYIRMELPEGTRTPTQEEIREAKNFILRRVEAASDAQELAGELIENAAEQLVHIGYKYSVSAQDFEFSGAKYPEMYSEASAVMDSLEEELYELLLDRATAVTDDVNRREYLIPLLLALGHRQMNLRETLHAYLWRTLRQVEAVVASLKYSNTSEAKASSGVGNSVKSLLSGGLLPPAKEQPAFSAPYVRNGGAATFPDGSPNVSGVPVEGAEAIKAIFGNAIARIWMQNQMLDMMEDNRCIGYWQDRGSNYPCNACDDEVGFHELNKGESATDPAYPHINCYCWRCPIYANGTMGEITDNTY